MTDIGKKALALLNEVRVERGLPARHGLSLYSDPFAEALRRAIEQHEAFRQEVSDAVEAAFNDPDIGPLKALQRFIVAKPDPLVEVLNTLMMPDYQQHQFREALAKRGGKIVWEND